MSGMFWIALELSIPKVGLNITLSLMVKEIDAVKFDGVAESDNTEGKPWLDLVALHFAGASLGCQQA